MAESVDALVSNTSGFTSMPVRLRLWVRKQKASNEAFFVKATVYIFYSSKADKYYIGSSKDFDLRYEFHLLKEISQIFSAQ